MQGSGTVLVVGEAGADGLPRPIAWESPQVPEKIVTGTIVQDVPASEAAKRLVGWLQEQKLI